MLFSCQCKVLIASQSRFLCNLASKSQYFNNFLIKHVCIIQTLPLCFQHRSPSQQPTEWANSTKHCWSWKRLKRWKLLRKLEENEEKSIEHIVKMIRALLAEHQDIVSQQLHLQFPEYLGWTNFRSASWHKKWPTMH